MSHSCRRPRNPGQNPFSYMVHRLITRWYGLTVAIGRTQMRQSDPWSVTLVGPGPASDFYRRDYRQPARS